MIRLLDEKLLAARLDARADGDVREGVAATRHDGLRMRVMGQAAIVTISGVIGPAEDCNVHPGELAAMLRRVAGEDMPPEVVLELDSPGGYLPGFADVQAAAMYLAGRKRVHAAAHEQASSLAFWIACYAHRIVATSSAMVGSIGVMCDVTDTSAQAAMAGVRVLPVTDAAGKMVSHPGVPQDESHVGFVRQQLLPLGERFRAMVAQSRRMDAGAIEALQGASMFGPEAMAAGLVDEVVNWHEWIEALAGGEPAAMDTTTKGAGMAAKKTTETGAAAKAAAGTASAMETAKELIDKYPERKKEIEGQMAQFVRQLGESMEAEGEGAEAADGPMDEEEAVQAADGPDAEPPVPMDEEAAKAQGGGEDAMAEDDQDEAQASDDAEDAKASAGSGSKVAAKAASAPATIDELEAFGKGADFVVAAAKAGLSKPQAAAMASGWAGSSAAPTRPKAAAPVSVAPEGGGGGGGDFGAMVKAYAAEHGVPLADAGKAVKAENPEAWAKAQQKQAERHRKLNFGRK